MPINKRRYRRIEELIYKPIIRQKENLSYEIISVLKKEESESHKIIEFDRNLVETYINDYTDYVILSIVNDFSDNKIGKNQCYKLVDKVEGYYYAFEENLIGALQLYDKLTNEIMIEELHKKNWNFIAVYRGD